MLVGGYSTTEPTRVIVFPPKLDSFQLDEVFSFRSMSGAVSSSSPPPSSEDPRSAPFEWHDSAEECRVDGEAELPIVAAAAMLRATCRGHECASSNHCYSHSHWNAGSRTKVCRRTSATQLSVCASASDTSRSAAGVSEAPPAGEPSNRAAGSMAEGTASMGNSDPWLCILQQDASCKASAMEPYTKFSTKRTRHRVG